MDPKAKRFLILLVVFTSAIVLHLFLGNVANFYAVIRSTVEVRVTEVLRPDGVQMVNVRAAELPCTQIDAHAPTRKPSRNTTGAHPYWTHPFKCLAQPTVKSPKSISLVILITTRPSAFERRRLIRSTWAGRFAQSSATQILFIYGIPSKSALTSKTQGEAADFKDLLVFDFVDTYRNLSLKSYLGFEYVLEKFPNAKYILKVDDDSLIFTDNVMELIRRSDHEAAAFYCHRLIRQVVRNESSPWYIPKSIYPGASYPPYCSGHAYLSTRAALHMALGFVKKLPHYFPIEDLLFTGLARNGTTKIQIHHSDGWHGFSKNATDWSHAYSVHRLSEMELRRYWERYVKNQSDRLK